MQLEGASIDVRRASPGEAYMVRGTPNFLDILPVGDVAPSTRRY